MFHNFFSTRLDESPDPKERIGLFLKLHHVIGDGMSCVYLLEHFLEYRDKTDEKEPPQLVHIPRPKRQWITVVLWLFSMWGVLGSILTVRTDPSNSLHPKRGRKGRAGNVLSSTKQGTSEPKIFLHTRLDLERIKSIADKHGHSVTTVLIAIIAGAFRRFLILNDDKVDRDLHAIIPISIRSEAQEEALGNNVLSAFVNLPVSSASPARRLQSCANQLEDLKAGPHFLLSKILLTFISLVPLNISRFFQERYANKVTVIISSIPGPKQPLTIAQSEIYGVYAVPPIIGRMAVSLATFSYVDSIGVGMLVNKNIPNIEQLPELFSNEIKDLENDFEKTSGRIATSNVTYSLFCLLFSAFVVGTILIVIKGLN